MTTQPKITFNRRVTACLLVAAIAMILGYYLGNGGFPSRGTELSPAEGKLIQNFRDLEAPETIDALSEAPQFYYRAILRRIPAPVDMTKDSPYVRLLRELDAKNPRPKAIAGDLRHIRAENIEPAIQALLETSSLEMIELAEWLAIKLARIKPERAISLARDFPTRREQEHITVNGVMQWAKSDSEKAFAWLTDELATVNGSARHIFFEIAQNNPHEAARHLKMVSNRDTVQYARWGILKGLAEVKQPNADTIAEFILDQPEPARSNLIYNLFRNYINFDTPETIEYLAKALAVRDGDLGQEAYQRIASTYAADHPKAAAEWSLQIANSDYRARTLEWVLRSWTKNDLDQAKEWLKPHPTDAVYDFSRSAVSREIAKSTPAEAIPYAESIVDDSLRYRALFLTISKWVENSPDEAIAYLKETPHLSDKERTQALEKLGQ